MNKMTENYVEFNEKCPVCGCSMALTNKYCCLDCYQQDQIEKGLLNNPQPTGQTLPKDLNSI